VSEFPNIESEQFSALYRYGYINYTNGSGFKSRCHSLFWVLAMAMSTTAVALAAAAALLCGFRFYGHVTNTSSGFKTRC
jgi:hypothetical protein